MSEKQFIHFRPIQTPYCEKAPVPLALRAVLGNKRAFHFFGNELSIKLEKSSSNGCTFALMSAETHSHGKR